MASQLQCAKCGGYKVERLAGKWNPENKIDGGAILLHGFLVLITLGIWIPILFFYYLFIYPGRAASEDDHMRCQICGYEWRRGDPQPEVTVDPDLIAKGEEKLRNDAAAAAYLAQQQRNKK